MIKCEDGVSIHSWLLLHPQSLSERIPTILFFHGNAGNIGLRLPNAHQMFKQMNANILMVEYRGYGDSDSVKPNEKGLKLDAEAALRFISNHPQIDPERIFCFGRSLGGAVAFHLAKYAEQAGLGLGSGSGSDASASSPSVSSAQNTNTNMDCENVQPLAGIMVENTFRSISTMVDQLMPMIAPLKFLVLRMDWSNEKIAPMITTPVLYLAGDRDELVPHDHMHHLYNLSRTATASENVSKVGASTRSTSKKSVLTQMHVINGGTHNDSWMKGGPQYFEKTRAFMSNIMLNEDGNTSTSSNTNTRSNSFRQSLDQHQHQQQPVEVVMGQEDGYGAHNAGELTSRNAIPIMPNNLVGMAKEASKGNANDNVSESDKKKNY
eukprot:CAMPEP_0194082282 /NCGR_PEP_ID=MMETSP0149-20130528/7831_1 /TAXON_ID=122233 /ORGANISM="Chaetoceros debilis, Strain MM31A-1" /LENGTH=378 /DNA_ID=CAMNT_0038764397 /DNA_START=385 /DNA_END=1521 /DNA_ORIENTATION=-